MPLLCPVCSANTTQVMLEKVRDYTVSQQTFAIAECKACSHRFTLNPPSETEIGAYYQSQNYISHSDTKQGLMNRLYHTVRNYMLKKKQHLIEKLAPQKTGKILDIGCGTAAFLATMKQANWQVMGLEPDAGARATAEKLHGISPQDTGALFAFPPESYAVVTMWHVLEHVHRLAEYVQQIHAILDAKGVFVVAVPNYTSRDAQHYDAVWAGYDVPRHLHHFSPASMKKLMDLHGFYVAEHHALPFDAFYVSMLSEKYKKNNFYLFSGFWQGFLSWWNARKQVEKGSSVIYVMRKK